MLELPKTKGSPMKKIQVLLLIVLLFVPSVPCLAENYVLVGQMGSEITYELQQQVKRGPGTKKLVLSFVVPPSFDSPTYHQEIHGFKFMFSPKPNAEERTQDKRGNQILTAT